MKKFLQNTRWGIVWGLFLVILHIIPGQYFPPLPRFIDLFQPDKIVHLFLFGVFVYLWARGLRKGGTPLVLIRYSGILAFFFGLVLGASLELVQEAFITNRVGSVWDFTANVIGCGIGWYLSKYPAPKSSN